MTTLHIDSVKLSASGKAYNVSAGGKFYVAGLKTGIEQADGKTVEVELGSFKSANGKTIETIEGFTLSPEQKTLTADPRSSNGGDRWWVPFVSNQCAHAIQCGLIKETGDLSLWARAAKIAILSADTMDQTDVPF